jgi:transposase InsO family protein
MTFIRTHAKDMISIDFFVVPTITFHVLFVFLVLGHDRRRVLHFNVTMNPSAEWTAQQIVESFPWTDAPTYLLRDRDSIYGSHFQRRVKSMAIEEIVIAPRSPWQNPYVERLIGSIRRECLDHVVVLNEKHLRRILRGYFRYYHSWRTHQALGMDAPAGRAVQTLGK